MTGKTTISGYEIHFVVDKPDAPVAYLIYPELAEMTDEWIEKMASDLQINLIIIHVPGSKWNDVLTPWPEPAEAKGFPPFAGEAFHFLELLKSDILYGVESQTGISKDVPRDLMGVSLSGLFALWQWMECDTFRSIACLSGSFWYAGFKEWFESQIIPKKTGKAYFLLGEEEPKAHIKAYQSVGTNTEIVVKRLESSGIQVQFEWVPGNHFSRPVHRAERALNALYS